MSRVVSGATGKIIPCCWTDCERLGDTRYQAIVREPQRNVIFLFCGDRHKMLWVNSTKSFGNLPSGSKSLS